MHSDCVFRRLALQLPIAPGVASNTQVVSPGGAFETDESDGHAQGNSPGSRRGPLHQSNDNTDVEGDPHSPRVGHGSGLKGLSSSTT